MSTSNAQGARGVQSMPLFLCVASRSYYFYAKAKKNALHRFSYGSGPHYVQENPLGVSGEDQQETCSQESKNAGRPGMGSLQSANPLHRGTDFNKAGALRGEAG